MGINLSVPPTRELRPRIVVIGVGGAGGNAINNMIGSGLEGVDFVAANTDAQALTHSLTERRIQLGLNRTQGLGAGMRPEVGHEAAEEAYDQIFEHLQGSNMAFVAAGMGGGTGTGAAPVIARVAKEMGILTVGVVTKPFQFEGARRLKLAEQGIAELQQYVDTLIVIPNQNLFRLANEKTTFADAFKLADNVLQSGVRGITDLMVMPGLINLDFADVRTVMNEMGKAMMGTGEAEGEKRALEAAERAIANPLLDDASMKGARGVLINITGGMDLTLYEVDEAANRIKSEVDPEANIIVGSTLDEKMTGKMRVTVVATGIDAAAVLPRPEAHPNVTPIRAVSRPAPQPTAVAPRPAAPVMRPTIQPTSHSTTHSTMAATALATAAPVPQAAVAAPAPAPVRAEVAQPIVPQPVMEQPAPVVRPAQIELPVAPVAKVDVEPELLLETVVAAPVETAAAESEQKARISGEHFIAPSPVNVPQPKPLVGRPNPFAEADMVNPPAAPGPRQSLFGRIFATRGQDASPAPAAPVAPVLRAPVAAAPEPRVTNAAPTRPAAPAPSGQALTLGGLDPADRPAPASSEDDLLEIPAFLRRQAN